MHVLATIIFYIIIDTMATPINDTLQLYTIQFTVLVLYRTIYIYCK